MAEPDQRMHHRKALGSKCFHLNSLTSSLPLLTLGYVTFKLNLAFCKVPVFTDKKA